MLAPPAYRTEGLLAAIARALIETPVRTTSQVPPASVLLNRVPLISAAYTMSGFSGLAATAWMLPTSVRLVQLQPVEPSARVLNTAPLVIGASVTHHGETVCPT